MTDVDYTDKFDPLERLYELGEVVAARLDGRELRWCERHGILLGLYQDSPVCPFQTLGCTKPYPNVDKNLNPTVLLHIYECTRKWTEKLADTSE